MSPSEFDRWAARVNAETRVVPTVRRRVNPWAVAAYVLLAAAYVGALFGVLWWGAR